jgi:glycosyltransferase involved in cell wall biosynthesis
MTVPPELRLAVLIPCYNEGLTVAKVVRDFRAALPSATIYVYDNNSVDDTRARATAAGAEVRLERQQGKGNVVRRMFADIDADIFVLVDGDDTYEAGDSPAMVDELVVHNLDLVNGRRTTESAGAYRTGHRFGNWFLTAMVARIFGRGLHDMLSGYKVFSRRYVKSFPAMASGFEIETELVIHALELRMPTAELPTAYRDRPTESPSKLSTWRDGFRILRTIFALMKEDRPLAFFTAGFVVLAALSLLLAWPLLLEYRATHLVPRLPTAILSTGLMLLAFLSCTCGFVLDTVTHGRREMKRLHYLSVPSTLARLEELRGTTQMPPARPVLRVAETIGER